MRIVTLNLNGLRSAINKGLKEWVQSTQADIYCFQELKADGPLAEVLLNSFEGYQGYHSTAEKKGYSGVGILTKSIPQDAVIGCSEPLYDREGRVLRVDLEQLSVLNVYVPSGTTGELRQSFKEGFMAFFASYLQKLQQERPRLVVVGDFNICHTEKDIHNPKGLKNTSGFLPHEREWVSSIILGGLVDSFRLVNQEAHQYTWWSQRGAARQKNLGWRLDYQFVTQPLVPHVSTHVLHSKAPFSDHIPTELVLQL